MSPESPVVQSSDVDEEESENQRLKMHRRLHGVGTRDVGYEQLWNAAKDEPGENEKHFFVSSILLPPFISSFTLLFLGFDCNNVVEIFVWGDMTSCLPDQFIQVMMDLTPSPRRTSTV